jgi:hypothetical protein
MLPELGPVAATVRLARYAPDEQRVVSEASGPFFLASSEKLTPELAVTIDGRSVRAVEADMLFAGVFVPAGNHEIVFSRRVARGWWSLGFTGAALWIIVSIAEVRGWFRRRRSPPATGE